MNMAVDCAFSILSLGFGEISQDISTLRLREGGTGGV